MSLFSLPELPSLNSMLDATTPGASSESPTLIVQPNGQPFGNGLDAYSASGAAGVLAQMIDTQSGGNSSIISPATGKPVTGNLTTDLGGKSSGFGFKDSGSLLYSTRAAAAVIGIIAIAGGILMFKQTGTIITSSAKLAAKVAA